MKSEADIRSRVQGLLVEELDRRLEDRVQRLPHCCVHNVRQPLDARKTVEGKPNESFNRITDNKSLPVLLTIGLCGLGKEDPETWNGTICEDPIDAKRCPDFTLKQDKHAIMAEFREELGSAEWIEGNMPEMVTLCWVLNTMAPVVRRQRIPWWKTLLVSLFGPTKVEPLTYVEDPIALLPESLLPEEGVDDDDASLSP